MEVRVGGMEEGKRGRKRRRGKGKRQTKGERKIESGVGGRVEEERKRARDGSWKGKRIKQRRRDGSCWVRGGR